MYMYICIHVCMCIYIYIYREREIRVCVYIYIYIYIYAHKHTHETTHKYNSTCNKVYVRMRRRDLPGRAAAVLAPHGLVPREGSRAPPGVRRGPRLRVMDSSGCAVVACETPCIVGFSCLDLRVPVELWVRPSWIEPAAKQKVIDVLAEWCVVSILAMLLEDCQWCLEGLVVQHVRTSTWTQAQPTLLGF